MANPQGAVDVPLSIFGSLDLELSPPDLPEGASPANNDVVFLPGSVATRPGLNRLFSLPVSSLGAISYQKSFVTPSGVIKNLYLTQGDGILWVEDVTNSPGTVTQLFQSSGATYASSCTALGREYIALSDGVHGVDIPLIYDGTNLTRLTQDGPGEAPVVTSVSLPSVALDAGGSTSASVTSITSVDPFINSQGNTVYAGTDIVLATAMALQIGQQVAVSGNTNSAFNGLPYYTVGAIISGSPGAITEFIAYDWWWLVYETGTGGTATGPGFTLARSNNTVTANTASAHNLIKGYQAQIQGAGASVVGGSISSIVINNEDNPGLATVTTTSAHGLLPQNNVNIQGVTGASVGGGIANIAFGGGVITITTSSAHGLSVGSEVIVSLGTTVSANGQWSVATVPSSTTFTYLFASSAAAFTTADTGTVTYIWPLASVDPSQNYFQVVTAPSSTTFTIALSYTDGTWTGGTITFPWDGIFYVTNVISTTQFQYQQYGPQSSTTTVGFSTPYGQASPGIHQCRYSFVLDDGSVTVPSPSVSFVANGGQYISVTQAGTGPTNVKARLFQFTGAGGAYFFSLLVPAVVNGLTVSTSTQISDNSTSAQVFDFSDNTLYSGTAVSIPGNDLAAQIVLDSQAGIFGYASRLFTWGGRNKINNFVNMGFDGGPQPLNSSNPSGWTVGTSGGLLVSSLVPGFAWQITSTGAGLHTDGVISQSAYLDTYGAQILLPQTAYSVRLKISWNNGTSGPNGQVIGGFTSNSAFLSSFTIAIPATASGSAYFSANIGTTPSLIPADAAFQIGLNLAPAGRVVTLDEIEIYQTDNPYLNAQSWASYAENLTGFDAITGVLGAADDTSPIRNFGTIRNALYLVTGTGLHESEDNGQTEPSNWGVNQVADNCGAFSIAAVARNPQGIGSAGKDWMMWNGPDGAQMFLGQKPFKVSQELQPLWDQLPAANAFQCWTKNYESSKRCYFGMPDANGNMYIAVLDYRNIDSSMIPENPPVHISFTGRMIVSDLTRKWTTWTIPAWSGELLYRSGVSFPQIVFGCLTPLNGGNSYLLNSNQYHDDDFGTIPSSYTTYFFVSHDQEQGLGLGSHRHIYTLAQAYIVGTGTWTLTPLAAALTNAQPAYSAWPLSDPQNFDIDFGINVMTTRCAFKVSAQPVSPSLDAYFNLQKLVISMRPDPNALVRGSTSGSY